MCALAVFFVCNKEFQGSQKKGPEPTLLRISTIEIAALQHPYKELLGKILRLIGRIAEDGGMRKEASDSLLSAASPRSFAVVRVESCSS